jgi:hypothetical protein
MSWPILLVVITVSFGLGAFWQSKREEDRRIQVQYPLPIMPYDNRGEYRMGRQPAERIAR